MEKTKNKLLKPLACLTLAAACLIPATSSALTSEELRVMAMEERIGANSEKLSILDRFSFNGDFRMRMENINADLQNANTTGDRTRLRIRFRIGGDFHLAENLDVGFRLAGGGINNPTSTNITLDNTAGTKDFDLDRAFAKWTPGQFELIAGKFGVPYLKSEMIFDSDLSLEGFSEKYTHKAGDTTMSMALGQYVVEETGDSLDSDVFMIAYQGQLEHKVSAGKLVLALSYYDFANLQGSAVTNNAGAGRRNTIAGGVYSFDFNIFEVAAQFKTDVMGKPTTFIYGNATNTADGVNNDQAWEAGVKIGKARDFGDWEAKALYRVTEADAVFSAWNDSDFHGGGVNSEGVELGVKVGLYKGVVLSVSQFFTDEESGAAEKHELTHVDLVLKF
ncbi:MAG: hypothetical protein G3M78_06960 [Candidatus Nitrohelix vancouverensis]|uniref:Porin n=1 Tax=Candidatus Nitrohelix vancouverensis TaxID=2705534 RepID=A0A7T0C275_9BACT|nr:MAG: hypothetical protein G3M78_06960 [Candidatus Nitrohelix vancouverensis]